MDSRIFPSKKDTWLIVVVALSVAITFLTGLGALIAADNSWDTIAGAAVALMGIGIVFLLIPTRYIIKGDDLTIRSGLFRWRIPIQDIERIHPSSSLRSSPALSLDRLRIDYRKGKGSTFVLISPEDRDGFLLALSQLDAALIPADSGVHRSSTDASSNQGS